MTARVPCPPAAGPLEDYCVHFDELCASVAQRRGFREYLTGLLAPRDRNKTLTALAGAEPVTGAQHAAVQRLQYFLSESPWDHEQINARRVAAARLMLPRHADTAKVIGAALVAKAVGHGWRTIVTRLGRPAASVRTWLRRAGDDRRPRDAGWGRGVPRSRECPQCPEGLLG